MTAPALRSRASLHRSIDATAESVDLKDHRIHAGLDRVFENSLSVIGYVWLVLEPLTK
jgi:hypothetical protein